MDIVQKTAHDLVKYFNCYIIGSYLFCNDNGNALLTIKDINDIDVAINGNLLYNIDSYLRDKGFKGLEDAVDIKTIKNYETFRNNILYVHEDSNLKLHILYLTEVNYNNFNVKSIYEIIKDKLERGSIIDLKQCKIIINNMIKNKKSNDNRN